LRCHYERTYYRLSILFSIRIVLFLFGKSDFLIFYVGERSWISNSKSGLTYARLLLARGSQRNHRSPSYSSDNTDGTRVDVGSRELSVRTSRSITRDSRMLHSCTLPSARHRYRRVVLTRVLLSGAQSRRRCVWTTGQKIDPRQINSWLSAISLSTLVFFNRLFV